MKRFVPAPSIGQTASETRCSQSMDTETQSPPWCSQPLKVNETICCPPLSAPDSRPATCNSYSQRQGDSSTSVVRSVLSRSHTKSLHPKGQEQGRQGCCHQWHSNSSASSSHLCKTVQNSVRSSGRALLDPFPQKLPGCHGTNYGWHNGRPFSNMDSTSLYCRKPLDSQLMDCGNRVIPDIWGGIQYNPKYSGYIYSVYYSDSDL